MKIKKHLLFLWIGLAFFALSFIFFLAGIVSLNKEFKAISSTLSTNDSNQFGLAFTIELFGYIFFGVPALLTELSLTRSVYKLLKYNLHGIVKICHIISAVVALAAFVFQCLIFSEVIILAPINGSVKFQETVLLLATWPPFMLSFTLGSISSRRTKDTADQNSNLSTFSN